MNAAPMIAHAVAEQTDKQRFGFGYSLAHNGSALDAEDAVGDYDRQGMSRTSPGAGSSLTYDRDGGNLSGTLRWSFQRSDPKGKFVHRRYVEIELDKGNITSVKGNKKQ